MANILASVGDGSVTLTAEAVKRLLDRGQGDAALLYLALLRHHGNTPPRSLAGELRWERLRLETAENVLREIGLIIPQAADLEPADEKPAYQREDIIEKLEQSAEFRGLTAEVERRLGKKLTAPSALPSVTARAAVPRCARSSGKATIGRGTASTTKPPPRNSSANMPNGKARCRNICGSCSWATVRPPPLRKNIWSPGWKWGFRRRLSPSLTTKPFSNAMS